MNPTKILIEVLIKLAPMLLNKSAVNTLLDAFLQFAENALGSTSSGYKLLAVVVNHAKDHGCIEALIEELLRIVSFGTGPSVAVHSGPLAPVASELQMLYSLCNE